MRIVSLLLIATGSFAACTDDKKAEEVPVVKSSIVDALPVATDEIEGSYIGDFAGSPITITITDVDDKKVSGYSVHKEVKRPFSGTVEATSTGFLRLQLSEPGDNQYDGVFSILLDSKSWTAKGTWQPINQGKPVNFAVKKQSSAATQ